MMKKQKLYALFQFFSTIMLFCILFGVFLVYYTILERNKINLNNGHTSNKIVWGKIFVAILTFDNDNSETYWIASILMYSSFILYLITIFISLFIYKLRDNTFDSLFLLFSVIPLTASLFCLFAQLAKENAFGHNQNI